MTEPPPDPSPGGSSEALAAWLAALAPPGLPAKTAAVVAVLRTRPRAAAWGTAAQVAALAGANVATVTRTAQALGFSGWPALQRELRARFLAALSAPEVAAEHGALAAEPAAAALRRDVDDIAVLARGDAVAAARRVASSIAAARRTLVVASGSYAAVGTALAHNASLAGYEVRFEEGGSAGAVNALARVGAADVVVAVSFWRLYASAVTALRVAADAGATAVAVTDSAGGPLAAAADQVLLVPAEGVSFFPSLTPALAAVQAVVAELAALDPGRTRASVERSDRLWHALGILDGVPRPRG